MENPAVKEQRKALVGATEAAVLRANNDCPNVIVFAAFDQKRVRILSTAVKKLLSSLIIERLIIH